MSFSGDVRKEICSCLKSRTQNLIFLYGMLLFCRKLEADKISFRTESKTSSEMFGNLMKRVFGFNAECTESVGKKGNLLYSYEITDESTIRRIFERYRLSSGERNISYDILPAGSLGIFTAGVFLSCGSVNDPEKEYHLEFTVPDEKLAQELCSLLEKTGITAKINIRKSHVTVYIKDSESIEDTLTFIGATNCTLELMNIKIFKDMRNQINRIANCDNANVKKAMKTANRQIEDIELISSVRGLDSLPMDLQEIAEMRLDNPSANLQEIGDSLSEPIGRSGVTKRFNRIKAIADEIRNGGAKNEK